MSIATIPTRMAARNVYFGDIVGETDIDGNDHFFVILNSMTHNGTRKFESAPIDEDGNITYEDRAWTEPMNTNTLLYTFGYVRP